MTTHTCMGDTWEKTAVQVGEVEEEPDLLTAAELDARSGASFDACVLKRFLAANRVPQRLPVLCLTPSELQLQSYSDVTPVCIIRYRLTSQALEALRTLMTSEEAIRALEKCNVHFSLMGSDFDLEVCGKEKLLVNSGHLDAHILQPTISCTRLVVGDIIEGNTEDLATNLTAAVEDAIQASSIVRSQRELLQQQRELKQRQDKEYSELLERENVRTQQDQQQQVLENSESEFDRTVQDTEQVRQKRLRFLEKEVEQSKRPREDIYDNDNDEDSSRIVTFPGINRDNIASQ
ncbi:uncharacterized protein [Montipora foliosa]|uniref:uncharacterized protein n=1 Tax=Montipora foliosa TaxID=591990 RepID=UPI0035F1FA86